MLAIRKLSPGGYEYLTGSVACADRQLEPGESLSDYYLAHGYPAGEWFGRGAQQLGMSGAVTASQMNALFGEGRHPDADRIQAEMIAAGHSEAEALRATKLGNRFAQYDGIDEIRSKVIDAYKQYNIDHDRPVGAPIAAEVRSAIRRDVQAQAYASAHEGQKPTDTELTKWLAEQKRAMKSATAGFELVFAPPKSVSVTWALADEPTRQLIADIHREAVRDTLSFLEDNVAYTRKGASGFTQHDVRGITAAIFEHWDSRAGDPHLHTHVPISTKVQGPDGRWTSLDGRTILAGAVTMSEFYNSRIRDLFRDHGASWSERPANGLDHKRPVWELDGVPNELLIGFSQRASQVEQERARQIVAYRRAHGHEPSPKELLEISRRAQYGTRAAKLAPRSLAEHMRRWLSQASEMVPDHVVADLGHRVFGGQPEPVAEPEVAALATATLAVVSDHYSHFNAWNIEAEAHRQSGHLRVRPGARRELVAEIVRTVIADADTIALEAPSLVAEPNALRRASGESVWVEHNSQRYTTHRTLREEAALAAWGRLTGGQRISTAAVTQALSGARLNDGQRRAVTEFATSGRRVQLLYAPAGAGKTTAMRVFAQAWRAEGGRVYAFGPSARASQELARSLSAKPSPARRTFSLGRRSRASEEPAPAVETRPHTLHQLTHAQRMGVAEQAFPFARGDVLIIDEVAMAGTHTLHDVVAYALNHGADVRFVGDDKQLAAVEAGGALRWFEHHNGAEHLREVVRFEDPDQAAASLLIREGNKAGLDYYLEQGWVRGGSRETMRDAAHNAWRSDLDSGVPTLLIVPTNEDVAALNRQARAMRIARGDVDDRRGVLLHDGTAASAGDWIVTRRNDRLKTLFSGRDFLKNGDTWDVLAVGETGALRVRNQASGGTIVLPSDYVAEYVELGYASTVNRVQGMTSQGNAHSLVPQGLSREQLYTMASRARFANRLYVETHQHTIDSHQETPPERTERGVLEAALIRSSAETSASEELRNSLSTEESLRTLIGRHDYVAMLGVDERIDAALTEHAPGMLDKPATPALRQTLYTAETLGWQMEHLVPAALARGRVDDAPDPAALLQGRIQRRIQHEQPPERTAAPTTAAINHWRGIIEEHDPAAAVEDAAWSRVWQLAAAAADEGLNADAAITTAAQALADRPSNDPMDADRFVAATVVTELQAQRAAGSGWHPALPWMARPNHTRLASSPDLRDYLRRLNTTIATRVADLQTAVTADPPAWTAALGPRPLDNPFAAERWDNIAGIGAAYRDTYNVHTADPGQPLGDEPDGHGLKKRAWQQLTDRWEPPGPGPAEPDVVAEQDAPERLRADIDPDELLDTIVTDELVSPGPPAERLSDLVARYRRSVTAATEQHRDQQIKQVLAARAPQVFDQPAEGALMRILRQAHDLGWTMGQAVPDADSLRGLHRANDPAAVLYRLVQNRIERAEPPTSADRDAPLGPLPWLTAADPAALAGHPELADHLHRLEQAIRDRAARLRAEVAADPPAWTAELGPRPGDSHEDRTHTAASQSTPVAAHPAEAQRPLPNEAADAVREEQEAPTTAPGSAERWDAAAGMAAAYRETYQITTADPDAPIGAQPGGEGPRAQAWKKIREQWGATAPRDQAHRNQQAIDALRAEVIDHDLPEDYHLDDADDATIASAAEHAADPDYPDDPVDEQHNLNTGLTY